MLRVKRFGSDYEVPIVKGFDKGALARGVGWYTKGAKPGEIGNFAIAGHRVTHGEPFSKFPKLKKGDLVVVETRRDIFTYKLRNSGTSITVPFTTSWPLWPVPDPDAPPQEADRAAHHVAHVLRAVPHQQPQRRDRRAREDVRQEAGHDRDQRLIAGGPRLLPCMTTSATSSSSPSSTRCSGSASSR